MLGHLVGVKSRAEVYILSINSIETIHSFVYFVFDCLTDDMYGFHTSFMFIVLEIQMIYNLDKRTL